MKLRGYLREYSYGTLPVDSSDFIATHYLICRETNDGLIPVAGYRWTSVDRSEAHGQVFGGLALARGSGTEQHVRVVESIMERCQRESKLLEYVGSWTMDPSVRKNRDHVRLIREYFDAIFVFASLESGAEALLGGTIRFKMHEAMLKFGAEPLKLNGRQLPPVHVPFLLGEPVLMMHMRRLDELARMASSHLHGWWSNRVVISGAHEKGDSLRNAA